MMQKEYSQTITEIKEIKQNDRQVWMTIELNGQNVAKLNEGKPVFGTAFKNQLRIMVIAIQ